MAKKLTALEIDRSKWGRGTGSGELLSVGGLMCCLGFACIKLGASEDEILDVGMPCDARNIEVYDEDEQLIFMDEEEGEDIHGDTDFSTRAANINDDRGLTDAGREEQLTELFAEHGIALTFVGGEDNAG